MNIGIYIVRPQGRHLRIIYEPKDQAKIKNKEKTLMVNEDFIKVGKATNLNSRNKSYKIIFGDNVIFDKVVLFEDVVVMRRFEDILKENFKPFRVPSPNNGTLLEWMKNITFDEAKSDIMHEIKGLFSLIRAIKVVVVSKQSQLLISS
jgi:hypothetical protein